MFLVLSGTLTEMTSYGCLVGANSRVMKQWQKKLFLSSDVQTYGMDRTHDDHVRWNQSEMEEKGYLEDSQIVRVLYVRSRGVDPGWTPGHVPPNIWRLWDIWDQRSAQYLGPNV